MPKEIAGIFVSGGAPSGLRKSDATGSNWLWFDSTNDKWYKQVGGEWVEAPHPHSHPTHGNINFTGTVSADGLQGVTGDFEGTFKKIKIQDGIIVEFELE